MKISLIVIIYSTVGIFVLTLLGLLAALLSKAARDRREQRAKERFTANRSLLRSPTSVSQHQIESWRNASNAEWEALVRAFDEVGQDPEFANPVIKLPLLESVAAGLRTGLNSRNAVRRGLALLLLGYLGRPSDCDLIAEFANDRDGDVRLCAIRALDLVASAEAFESLLNLLRPDTPHPVTPLAEARIVERLANPWAWPYLRDALAEHQPNVDTSSDQRNEIALTHTQGDRQALALMRAIALSRIHIEPVEIHRWIAQGTVDERAAAVRTLSACTTALSAELQLALSDASPIVRAQAVKAIAEVEIPDRAREKVVAVLTEAMTDPDWWIRGYAASSLASLGAQGISALHQVALGSDPYAAHRAREQLEFLGAVA